MHKITFHSQNGKIFETVSDIVTFSRLFAQRIWYFRVNGSMYAPGSFDGRYEAERLFGHPLIA